MRSNDGEVYPPSPVILALRQTQLTVHDKLCGGFKVGVAVGHGLGILGRELAQHPVGKVIVRAGLGTHADADAGEVLPAQPGNDDGATKLT